MAARRGTASGDGGSRSDEQLRRIAETLGLPLGAFLERGPAPGEPAQGREMLRLWAALDRDADRQRVLQFMRGLTVGQTGA